MENLLSDLQGRVELEGGPGSLGTVNRNRAPREQKQNIGGRKGLGVRDDGQWFCAARAEERHWTALRT